MLLAMSPMRDEATLFKLVSPSDLAFDASGRLWVADRSLNRVYPVQEDGSLGRPWQRDEFALAYSSTYGIDIDASDNLYIADVYFQNVRRVAPDGREILMDGSGRTTADRSLDDPPKVDRPVAVAVEPGGSILVAALFGDRVWRWREGSAAEIVAGNGRRGVAGDGGPAIEAELCSPRSITVGKDGHIYVAEKFANRIRMIDRRGHIHTIAGNGHRGDGADDIMGRAASLAGPEGVAVDRDGRVWIADTGNHRVRLLDRDGLIHIMAGTGAPGRSDEPAPATQFPLRAPRAVAVDDTGRAYVADTGNRRVCVIEPDTVMRTLAS
jgi:DNA-binding beta-propeller fold protein YncE